MPLFLGVRRLSGAEVKLSGDPRRSKGDLEKIMRRDDFTCRYCGFHSLKYQRVVSSGGADPDKPFVTACTFCEQCLLLERTGIAGAGVLIWLPEIDQATLNHLAHAIYVARATKGPVADLANRALDALMVRRADAKKRLGSDDPLLLATVLRENINDEEAKDIEAKLEGLRLLPLDKYVMRGPQGDVDQFPSMIKYWLSSEGPYAQLPVEKWTELFRGVGV